MVKIELLITFQSPAHRVLRPLILPGILSSFFLSYSSEHSTLIMRPTDIHVKTTPIRSTHSDS